MKIFGKCLRDSIEVKMANSLELVDIETAEYIAYVEVKRYNSVHFKWLYTFLSVKSQSSVADWGNFAISQKYIKVYS